MNFGFGRVANFKDQISIRGVDGEFGRGGDSGSLIRAWDAPPSAGRPAVRRGILPGTTMCRALSALDITLM